MRSVDSLRYYRDPFGFDNGIVFNLETIPEHIKSIVPYMELKNVNKLSDENEAKKIKNAVYQI